MLEAIGMIGTAATLIGKVFDAFTTDEAKDKSSVNAGREANRNSENHCDACHEWMHRQQDTVSLSDEAKEAFEGADADVDAGEESEETRYKRQIAEIDKRIQEAEAKGDQGALVKALNEKVHIQGQHALKQMMQEATRKSQVGPDSLPNQRAA